MKLLDGPGAGKDFLVRRCPIFVRVVETPDAALFDAGRSTWDVLDMPDDEPQRGEVIHVYRREGRVDLAWIDGPTARGRYAFAEYRHVPTMPEEERDLRERWPEWCVAKAAELGVEVPA